MFTVKNLSILLNDQYMIKDLSFTVNANDKLAIIGEEGNGKTTLLKVFANACDYATVTGFIDAKNLKLGYLKQTLEKEEENKKVFAFLFANTNDYYEKIGLFYKYLKPLNIKEEILEQKINTLSGGEKVKIRILKLLLEKNDILLLDEPTNDLDIETLEWLERFINTTQKPMIYVSHDETLLERTANKILHIERIKHKTEAKYTYQKIDYKTYIQTRLKALDKQTQMAKAEKKEQDKKQEKLKKVMQKVEQEQNHISRSDPHGAKVLKKKMHSLKTQERKLENNSLLDEPDVEESICFFFENVKIPNKKIILELHLDHLTVGEKNLSKNIELNIYGSEHVCIIGKNGVGKTTLMKMIAKDLQERKDIKVGIMTQNYEEILSHYETVLDFLEADNKEMQQRARTYLGNMNFTKEETLGKIASLSNGTKAKLFLVKFAMENCDVLLLDEPTRNLSPLSNPVIRKALKEFKGTIISVSHDRKYIEEVINHLYLLNEEGLVKKY